MSDQITTPQAGAEQTPAEVQVTPPAAPVQPTEPGGTVDQLPEWAQKLVTDLRKENASHRKAKTEAEKAAELAAERAAAEQGEFKRLYEDAKQKLEAEQAARKIAELAHLRAKVGAKYHLPAELIERLRGETEDELDADASALLAVLPKPAATTDAAQGVSAGKPPTPGMSDEELREMAAVYGVSFEHLKATMNRRQ